VSSRVTEATSLELRELQRRPLLLVLLVALPFFFITRAIASTVPQPRTVPLPGGSEVLSNMQDVHGATMALITIAFLAGLCGLFIMQSAREADRRLVVAGFRPAEAVLPRLAAIGVTTAIVVTVSLLVTALSFTPERWLVFVIANVLIGLTYASIGALAGVALGRLGGTYFMFFLPMVDLGIAQTPMFGDGGPDGWAILLPGYGAGRVAVDAAFSPGFHAWGELFVAVIWALGALVVVGAVLVRWLGVEGAGSRGDARAGLG
jgi:hypothetical protein